MVERPTFNGSSSMTPQALAYGRVFLAEPGCNQKWVERRPDRSLMRCALAIQFTRGSLFRATCWLKSEGVDDALRLHTLRLIR
jgi:hypothetical protein